MAFIKNGDPSPISVIYKTADEDAEAEELNAETRKRFETLKTETNESKDARSKAN